MGMFILWMGWFGFNGGSMLKIASLDDANAVARIFVNTNTAAASGMVAAALFYRWKFGASLLVLWIIRMTMGLRVSEQEEFEGMDVHECGISAYPECVSSHTQETGAANKQENPSKSKLTETKPALR